MIASRCGRVLWTCGWHTCMRMQCAVCTLLPRLDPATLVGIPKCNRSWGPCTYIHVHRYAHTYVHMYRYICIGTYVHTPHLNYTSQISCFALIHSAISVQMPFIDRINQPWSLLRCMTCISFKSWTYRLKPIAQFPLHNLPFSCSSLSLTATF